MSEETKKYAEAYAAMDIIALMGVEPKSISEAARAVLADELQRRVTSIEEAAKYRAQTAEPSCSEIAFDRAANAVGSASSRNNKAADNSDKPFHRWLPRLLVMIKKLLVLIALAAVQGWLLSLRNEAVLTGSGAALGYEFLHIPALLAALYLCCRLSPWPAVPSGAFFGGRGTLFDIQRSEVRERHGLAVSAMQIGFLSLALGLMLIVIDLFLVVVDQMALLKENLGILALELMLIGFLLVVLISMWHLQIWSFMLLMALALADDVQRWYTTFSDPKDSLLNIDGTVSGMLLMLIPKTLDILVPGLFALWGALRVRDALRLKAPASNSQPSALA